jgi:NADH-quinone oxidoreductase subunit N
VYEGSPNKTTAFFAVMPKIALFVLLTRFCYNSFYYIFIDHYQIYFSILSIISIFIGSLGGLEQRKIKTLFAYSSLSHTGYILLSFSTGSVEGTHLMFYYLVLYMLSGMCFWSVYLFLIKKSSYYSNKNNKELGDFVLLKESNPMLALILTITLFSIAGIPPIVGFLAKIGIFLVVIKSSAYFLAVIGIVLSVVSTFYYIRFIKVIYFDNSKVGKLYIPITTNKSLFIAFLAILLLLLCFNPVILYLVVYKAVLLLNY